MENLEEFGLILTRDSDGFWSLYPETEHLEKIEDGTARPLRVGIGGPVRSGNWTRPDRRDIQIALMEHALRQAGE